MCPEILFPQRGAQEHDSLRALSIGLRVAFLVCSLASSFVVDRDEDGDIGCRDGQGSCGGGGVPRGAVVAVISF